MARVRTALVALHAVLVREPVVLAPEEPLPRIALPAPGPRAEQWTRHRARLTAARVSLNGLGIRTHANWVLFRLPFDPRDGDRIRHVEIVPSATVPTAVGALRLGGLCVTTRPSGEVSAWTPYTTSGVAYTQRFAWHPAPPTDDPTVYGINVPTRVANHVACGRDERLREPERWILDVEWESR